jgi:HK97 gp10 family phage protein
MASVNSQYVQGLDELDAKLKSLTDVGRDKDSRKALRRAMSQGGAVFRKEMRATAPSRPNEPKLRKFPKLKNDIRQSVRFLTRESQVLVKVGPRKAQPVARWYEFGTSKQKPRPWLRPLFDRMAQPALDKVVSELRRMVEQVSK